MRRGFLARLEAIQLEVIKWCRMLLWTSVGMPLFRRGGLGPFQYMLSELKVQRSGTWRDDAISTS
ncbi:hypothetical protein MPLB_1500002 [Mesorhizobium sp. ORS 3324]|nr:hypothetical protein MPLB_1500002 [Mesorhizobium sp. ORS 3324]